MSTILCRACVVVMLLVTAASAQEMPKDQPPLWSAKPDVAAFENTLAYYDEATRQLNAAIYFSTLIQQVHPDATYRDRATAMTTKDKQRSNRTLTKSAGLSGSGSS